MFIKTIKIYNLFIGHNLSQKNEPLTTQFLQNAIWLKLITKKLLKSKYLTNSDNILTKVIVITGSLATFSGLYVRFFLHKINFSLQCDKVI